MAHGAQGEKQFRPQDGGNVLEHSQSSWCS
jgi:hypothetical protein